MAGNSGLMDWAPDGVAQRFSAPTLPYYRGIDMPGGFPLTPSRPSTPVFERVRPATDDGAISHASKRLCTTAARAASAFTYTASISMNAIIRNMQRMRFRARRAPQPESRIPCENRLATRITASPTDVVLLSNPSQSLPGPVSQEAQTHPQRAPEPKTKLVSPFTIFKPTYGKWAAFSPARTTDSSPTRQVAAKLNTAAEDSDSSTTFDSKWLTLGTPTLQLKSSSITPTSDLSSAAPDTTDWHHDSIGWEQHVAFTSTSPTKDSTLRSRAELLEDEQTNYRKARAALLNAKKARGDTSKFDIKPLTKDWEAKVDAALQTGHGNLQARDFQKIVPPNGKAGIDAWLNDESINQYLSLITNHANKDIKPKATPRMHAFSTFFYTSLKTGGYPKVARWAKRANLAGAALLSVDKIFIPINPNQSHWTLAVIEPRSRRITHYNSFGGGSKAYLDVICEWLKGELGARFNKDDWTLDYRAESPQQSNNSDCGVFTVTTAKQIMLGINPMTYGPKDIPTQRRRMVAELVKGELLQNGN